MDTSLCRVRVYKDRLRHNLHWLQSLGVPLMPVLKANAYGHGLLCCADIVMEAGIEQVAVGTVSEGCHLREYGYTGALVALLGLVPDGVPSTDPNVVESSVIRHDIEKAQAARITPLVHDWASLRVAAQGFGHSQPIAIKCDTGMARLGFQVSDMPAVTEFLKANPHLEPTLLLAHYAVADEPDQDEFTKAQAARMAEAARVFRAHFPNIRVSMGNTACLLSFPELAGDLARSGQALYGDNPLARTSRASCGAALQPVMEVSAPVLSVHPLAAGTSIGYGRLYTPDHNITVAVVGMGYADGLRRVQFGQPQMNVHGVRVPILGRISMQMTAVDVSSVPETRAGDYACMLGGSGDTIRPGDVAEWWGTIGYEVTCIFGKSRIYS